MRVRVDEPGQHQPVTDLDDARRRPDERVHVALGSNGDDPVATSGDGAGLRAGGVHRVDPPTAEDEVCGGYCSVQVSFSAVAVRPSGPVLDAFTFADIAVTRTWLRAPTYGAISM